MVDRDWISNATKVVRSAMRAIGGPVTIGYQSPGIAATQPSEGSNVRVWLPGLTIDILCPSEHAKECAIELRKRIELPEELKSRARRKKP